MGYSDATWNWSWRADCASISFASSYPCRARSSRSASRIISALPFCISALAIDIRYICGRTIYQGWQAEAPAPPRRRLLHRVLRQRPRDELPDIVLQLGARIVIDVQHVTRLVIVPDHIFVHVRIQAHVIERVLDGEVRRRQVEVRRR